MKDYNPPKKEKKETKLKIFENDKSTKQVKFEEPTLKLEEEEPLILEEIHDEKTQATNEKQVSPAARKIANEAKVDPVAITMFFDVIFNLLLFFS